MLPEIERVAGLLFRTFPEDLGTPDALWGEPDPVETFVEAQRAGHLWVATVGSDGRVVGFALMREIERFAHLEELDVLPSFGRRGIGASLLAAVCAWADGAGYPAVTLRTFRDVPWNGPFYESRGFAVVDSATLSERHVALEPAEARSGLRTDNRVSMVYRFEARRRGTPGGHRRHHR